jgi:N-acetylmuramoyl-L-alanine amidase
VVIDDQVFQMSKHAIGKYDEIYVPAESFFSILKQSILPGLDYDATKRLLSLNLIEFNINGVAIQQKSNGTILRVNTSRQFSDGDISSFVNNNGWFYLTVREGIIDTSMIKKTDTRGVVTKVTSNQFDESAQLAFQLRSDIIGHEVYQSSDPNAIIVTLRTPFKKLATHIKDMKKRWRLDTVVLDAGHGGKDPGTSGKYGTKEKDIVLDITKRVGRLLEKNTGIKVVYTRTEDIFIPLWKRTKIANEAGGEVFVSIHINSNTNRKVKGFETY